MSIFSKTKLLFPNSETLVPQRISEFGNKSFVFENILIDKNKQLKCLAKSVMVCFDYIENSTILVPDDWKLKIKSFEERR
jgi:acyl-CoA thioesterase FadM